MPMIWLFRKLFWIALFLIATHGFLVLFEHGPANYVKNFQDDLYKYQSSFAPRPEPKKDDKHKTGK